MVEHTRNPRIEEAEAGESQVQDYPQLHNDFGASFGYMKTVSPPPNGWGAMGENGTPETRHRV